jgi:DNA-binding PadR family transcriptional regulator
MDRRFHHKRPARRIGIPRGMLRNIVLNIIKRSPMSGSELIEEIEYYTDWKPSPGSMYPLLSKLEEQGLIEALESDDPYLKRYGVTSEGMKTIDEHKKRRDHFRARFQSIQKMYWKLFEEMNEDLFKAQSRLLNAVQKIHFLLKDDPDASSSVHELLHVTAEKIEEINRRLEEHE